MTKAKDKNPSNNKKEEIPVGVKDVEAYKKYKSMEGHSMFVREERCFETSEGEVLDPQASLGSINKRINHLSSEEQEKIVKRCRAYHHQMMRVTKLKTKAFGLDRRGRRNDLLMGMLDERSSELIEYFGAMYDVHEVMKIVKKDWGYNVTEYAMKRFAATYKTQIEAKQVKFQKDYSSIKLSHIRGRLEELADLFKKTKMRYETAPTKTDAELMLRILKQISDETGDKTLRLEANINANINLTINNHIQKEVMKGLTINDIIIARVAARMNINPRFLITRLHNSIYAKHSGFIRPDGALENQEIVYPSQMVYNWTDIDKLHEEKSDANIEDTEWEEVPLIKKQSAEDKRKAMLASLQERNADINQAKNRVRDNLKK